MLNKLVAVVALPLVLAACGGVDDLSDPTGPAGKADYFGNDGLGEGCTMYFACAADQGLTCRYDEAGVSKVQWAGPIFLSSCLPLGEVGDGCWRDDNCAEGLVCQGAAGIHAMGFSLGGTPVYGTTGACAELAAE